MRTAVEYLRIPPKQVGCVWLAFLFVRTRVDESSGIDRTVCKKMAIINKNDYENIKKAISKYYLFEEK